MSGWNGSRGALAWALWGAGILVGSLGAAGATSAGTAANPVGGTNQTTAVAPALCKAFATRFEGVQAHAVLAWASRKLGASCDQPGIPPTGEDCVAQSLYFQECVDCCVFNGQVSQECSSKCFEAFPIYPVLPVPYPGPPTTPDEKCCHSWCATGQGFGLSACCNGHELSCDCTPGIAPNPEHPGLGPILDHISFCVNECEGMHQKNYDCAPGVPYQIWEDPLCGSPCSECEVNRCFSRCADKLDCATTAEPDACLEIQAEIRANRDQYCNECTKCRETHK